MNKDAVKFSIEEMALLFNDKRIKSNWKETFRFGANTLWYIDGQTSQEDAVRYLWSIFFMSKRNGNLKRMGMSRRLIWLLTDTPLRKIPLYLFHGSEYQKAIAEWRLKIGK